MRVGWGVVSVVVLASAFAALGLAGDASAAVGTIPRWTQTPLDPPFVHAGEPGPNASYPEIMGSGACVFDADGDGWEDLLLLNADFSDPAKAAASDPVSALYRNVGGGALVEVPGAFVARGWTLGCASGDHDRDGDIDVAVSTWGAGVLLYRNDGGVFTNVTAASGLSEPDCGGVPCFGASLAWLDFDLDADLDLYALNYVAWDGEGVAAPFYPGQCNVLFRNDGGVFANVTSAAGAGDCGGAHLAVAIADVDGNGYQDIFVASDETQDAFLLNQGNGTFVDRADELGVNDTRGGMGAAWGDYDGDGLYDLVITHFENERFGLYRQRAGMQGFDDRAAIDGLDHTRNYVGWGAELADLDADGLLDLVLVNGHVNVSYSQFVGYAQRDLVLRNTGGRFVDVTNGSWPQPELDVSRGLALADLDEDGYLDAVVVNNANETARVYRSERGPNNWLTLRLSGNATVNPQALGAVATVRTESGVQRREVVGSASYLSQGSRDLHFGLGDAREVLELRIEWPDGTEQSFTGLAELRPNAALSVSAGGSPVLRRAFPVAGAPATIVGDRATPVRLEGVPLHAAEGIASETWTVGGVTHAGRVVEHAFATLGAHEAVYRVVDVDGRVDEAVVEVTIVNLAPTVAISGPGEVPARAALTLSSEADDADGEIVNWTWSLGDRVAFGPSATFTLDATGAFEARLTVRDDDGATASATRAVQVTTLAPVVDPGRPLVGPPGEVFGFRSRSTDPDGAVARWTWDFGDGSGATCDATGCVGSGEDVVTIPGETTAGKSYSAEGVHVVTLTVTDDLGAQASATITATVDASVATPSPSLDAPASADRVAPITLDARASADPDGELVLYSWEMGDGATRECLCPVVEHRYAALGTYEARVTVVDDDGAWAEARASIAVANLAPTVDATSTLVHVLPGPLALAATGLDPEGDALAWSWDPGDGSAILAGREVTHAYATHGTYEAVVTARDAEGGATSAAVAVEVRARPDAAFAAPSTADRATDARFDAGASADPDGGIVAWRWDLGDGASAQGREVEHRYAALGTYLVTLAVTDDDGLTATAQRWVSVVNLPPVARIDAPALANVGQLVAYDGAASEDADGAIVRWTWRFDEGPPAGGPAAVASHAFDAPGARNVTLVVEDDAGATATTTLAVDVVTWLDVVVTMDRGTFAPDETPTGTVVVRYANGAPAAGAVVNGTSDLVARLPGIELGLYRMRFDGVANENGTFSFAVPGPADDAAPLRHPTLALETPLGVVGAEHEVLVRAAVGPNEGDARTRYGVP